MKRLLWIFVLVGVLSGCAISGKGNFPYPVWFWECGDKPEDERC